MLVCSEECLSLSIVIFLFLCIFVFKHVVEGSCPKSPIVMTG